jgi:DNA primase
VIPPRLDFRRLKRRVGIEQLLQANGCLAGMQRRGRRLVGRCPLHGGDNPRAFVADLSKNLWYCFTGCRAGGDVVELARRLLGLSYPEAARYLASLAENAPKRKGSGQGPG